MASPLTYRVRSQFVLVSVRFAHVLGLAGLAGLDVERLVLTCQRTVLGPGLDAQKRHVPVSVSVFLPCHTEPTSTGHHSVNPSTGELQ